MPMVRRARAAAGPASLNAGAEQWRLWISNSRQRERPVRLTNYTDYTLRMLIYLALKTEGRATIAEISAHYGIAETHLMKVAHELGVAGDIETIRGKGGGLRLARRPETIRVGEIVRRTEPDLTIVPCFAEQASCVIEPECVLQRAMQKALQTFLAELDRYTLADLVAPRRRLLALLEIQSSRPGRRARASTRQVVA